MRVLKSVTSRYYLASFAPQDGPQHDKFCIGPHHKGAAFNIHRELDGPEIPRQMQGNGDYFVLEVVRKFRVTPHDHPTWYTMEEL